jgi:hypothetical protein
VRHQISFKVGVYGTHYCKVVAISERQGQLDSKNHPQISRYDEFWRIQRMKHLIFLAQSTFLAFGIMLPLVIIGIPIIAIALLFFIKDRRIARLDLIDQRLPKFIAWFDNGDELDRRFGLNGDYWFQSKMLLDADYPGTALKLNNILNLVYDPQDNAEDHNVPWYKIYWMRFIWLAWRNTISHFKRVIGEPLDNVKQINKIVNIVHKDGQKIEFHLNEPVKSAHDIPNYLNIPQVGDWYNEGYRYVEMETEAGKILREYYYIKILPKWLWFGKRRCLRIRIGYKLGHLGQILSGHEIISRVFVVQPRRYTGHVSKN